MNALFKAVARSGIWCKILGHDWLDTGTNPFGATVEQRCYRCGNMRHHLLVDTQGEGDIRWRDGRHPNSK